MSTRVARRLQCSHIRHATDRSSQGSFSFISARLMPQRYIQSPTRPRTASMAKMAVCFLSVGTPSTARSTSAGVSFSAWLNVSPSTIEQIALAQPVMARHPRLLNPTFTNTGSATESSTSANRRSATSPRLLRPTMLCTLKFSGLPEFLKFATMASNVSE